MDYYRQAVQAIKSQDTEDILDGIPDHTITTWLLQRTVRPKYGEDGVFLDPEHQVIFNEIRDELAAKLKMDLNDMSDEDRKEFFRGITDALNVHMQHAYQLRGLL